MGLEVRQKNKRCLVLSCFCGEFDAGRRRRSKTVPVDDQVECKTGNIDGDIAVSHRKSFLERLRKAKARRNDDKEKPRDNHKHPQAILETNKCKDTSLGHTTNSTHKKKREPAPLLSARDLGRTATGTNHSSSPEMKHTWRAKKGNGRSSWTALPVITVVLLLVLIAGRASAVFCLCAWFYALPRLRVPRNMDVVGTQSSVATLDSEMDKKRIVLEGLLRRSRRRC